MNKWLERHVWWIIAAAVFIVAIGLYSNYSRWGVEAVVNSMLYAVPALLIGGIMLWAFGWHRAPNKKK